MEQNKLRNAYIFTISNNHSFIPQTLKVVGPLGKKIIFSVPKKLSETLETREVYENHISVHFCSSPNLSNNPNYQLSMRTMLFLDYDFSRRIYEVL